MAATLIVEDGSGLTNSNAYLCVAEADAFFANHLQNAQWLAVTDADFKARLIITSSRIIDNCVDYKGWKAVIGQAMQWPRILARDENRFGGIFWLSPDSYLSQYFDPTQVPAVLKEAVCEMARFLLAGQLSSDDRMADAPGVGIDSFEIYEGIKVKFNSKSLRPIVPEFVNDILQQFGDVRGTGITFARMQR